MKTTLLLIAISFVVYSCSKGNINQRNQSYLGTYNDSKGDTAIVTENGNYLKIDWRRHGGLLPYVFDSVVLNSDLTFTDNESVTIMWPTAYTFQSVGTGNFGTNTMNFTFVASGATIIYNGIKR